MKVLIHVQQPVVAWTIPPSHVVRLRERFSHITFEHAVTDAAAAEALREADVAFTWIMRPEIVPAAPRLRWVHSSAAAVGTLPLRELGERGVTITNSRGIQSMSMAEHVLAVMLALLRRLPDAIHAQAAREWIQNRLVGSAAPGVVHGRTMVIVGLGTIGCAVASRAAALGMRVVGVRRHPERPHPEGVAEVVGPGDLGSVLPSCDVLVLAAPLTGSTEQMIGSRELALLPPHAMLINVARGQLVDETALADALAAGRLGGASLDVFTEEPLPSSSPFWTLTNVILTPHTSGFRADHWDAVIDLFSENLRRFERGQKLLNVVDWVEGY